MARGNSGSCGRIIDILVRVTRKDSTCLCWGPRFHQPLFHWSQMSCSFQWNSLDAAALPWQRWLCFCFQSQMSWMQSWWVWPLWASPVVCQPFDLTPSLHWKPPYCPPTAESPSQVPWSSPTVGPRLQPGRTQQQPRTPYQVRRDWDWALCTACCTAYHQEAPRSSSPVGTSLLYR